MSAMRSKFVLAPNGDQLVPSCLSVVQELSTFQGVHSEGFNCKPKTTLVHTSTQSSAHNRSLASL